MNGEGAGKGDSPRPKSVDEKTYGKNFHRVFGKKQMWWETNKHKKWTKQACLDKKRL